MNNEPIDPLISALRQIFGFDSFRPNQKEIITAILHNQDVFAIMPTGGGKSLCYQFPAVILPGLCVVVSPLLSLMKDQVDAACESGIRAETLNSVSTKDDFIRISRLMEKNELDLLYISPERFNSESFIPWIKQGKIAFFAVDEAHCISQWGHHFRPDYLGLSRITKEFPNVPLAVFTATATTFVANDIEKQLKLRNPFRVRASFDRPNLFYEVKFKNDLSSQLVNFLKTRGGQSGIIYRGTRKKVEETASMLVKKGFKAKAYHAGLSDQIRMKVQEEFLKDEVPIIVATIAFGMGIDKSNVRFVVHGDLPKNIESYYQETGRAGRDGLPAHCLLLFGYQDIALLESFIDDLPEGKIKHAEERQLQEMIRFADTEQCRRKSILAYFEENYPNENCGNCDFCTKKAVREDATVDCQKALSAMARTGCRFGITHLIDILLGADTEKIKTFRHNLLKTWGIGKNRTKKFWRQLFNTMLSKDLIQWDKQCKFPVPLITDKGKKVLFGKEKVELVLRPDEKKSSSQVLLTDENIKDQLLFDRLRVLRKEIAQEKHIFPYNVFTDKSLQDMVRIKPKNMSEMQLVQGMGRSKIKAYGKLFLNAIIEFLGEKK
ncbi:MAG: DNA helicase RecQ [Planctomycetia bacterium]|nr:DNA helicase RecQ [Planctomycetia bacterium]